MQEQGKGNGVRHVPVPRRLLCRRLLKHWPPVVLALLVGFTLSGLGFIAFSEAVYRMQPPVPLQAADGIIVLTGGRARLETGLKLLEDGKGKRLLISGVNPLAGRRVLAEVTQADPRLFACCVDLGRKAVNTIGNAEESARWVEKNGYRTVFVVTSNYHMPRSLSELRRRMPGTELIPYPVEQNGGESNSLLQSFAHLRILMMEYVKFLGISVRNIVM